MKKMLALWMIVCLIILSIPIAHADCSHEFDEQGHCMLCDYQCPHTDVETFTAIDGGSEVYTCLNDTEHQWTFDDLTIQHCNTCGYEQEIGRTPKTEVWPHNYNGAGICKNCGYETDCPHANVTHVKDEHVEFFKDIGNHRQHEKFTDVDVEYDRCEDCGTHLNETVSGGSSEIEDHIYSSVNICIFCGHKNTCTHPNLQIFTAVDGDSEVYTCLNDTEHQWTFDDLTIEHCDDCGYDKVVAKERKTEVSGHNYNGDGICKNCGYETDCPHANVTHVKDEHVEFFKDIGSDRQHEKFTDANVEYDRCEDCGTHLNETVSGGSSEIVDHIYSSANICIFCGHQQGGTVQPHVHVPGEAVKENEVPATTEAEGSYDEVVYCSTCGEELSRERKVIEKLLHEHTPGAPVRENEVKATTTTRGHYDEVVYCTVCGEELSREEKAINKSVKGLTITGEPEDAMVKNGEKAKFTVKISGKATAIQWYYRTKPTAKWKKVSSKGNKLTLTVAAKPGNDGYQYRCELKNGKKKLYTDPVTLDVELFPPTISSQPESVAIKAGEEATFTFGVEGDGVTYAWSYRKSATGKWAAVKGGTSATLTVTGTAANAGYQYKCEAKNKDGSVTSDIVTLDVEYHLPEIVTQPKGAKVKKNAKVTFNVEANDPYDEELTFQWYYRKSSKAKWTKIKGATEATYSFKATAKKNGYQYKCDITNRDGTVSTKAVTLKVK